MNTVSFMSANYVARQLGYNMTEGWMQGDNATNAYFRPIETFGERFGQILSHVRELGFRAIDIWLAHLNPAWATDEHIRIAQEMLKMHEMTVPSLAGFFGNTADEFEKVCELAVAVGTPVLGGSCALNHQPETRATMVALLQKYGLKFGIENHPEKTPEEVLAQIGDGGEGTIGAAIDTGWFGTQGYDAAKAIEVLGPHLVHVHLKDVRAAGGHDTCRFGAGVVPIERCVQAIQKVGYMGAIAIEHEPEHFDPTDDVQASMHMLKGWLAQ